VPSNIPNDDAAGIREGNLVVMSEEIEQVFENVITTIIFLIREQIEMVQVSGISKVSAILLVGGFGGSEYLYTKIKEHFGDETSVIRPVHA
jgi:uncharacterized protein (UPF0254 family)